MLHGSVDERLPGLANRGRQGHFRPGLEQQNEHVRVHTPDGEPSRWLFYEEGKPWHDNLVDHRWRSTRADAGVAYKLHELRHYFASGLIAAGCDVVTVQRAMGHASATTTLSTYAHLWPTAEDKTRSAAAGMASEVLSDETARAPAG